MAIEWNEKLATGNNDIDNQHKELFRKFDSLLEACKQRKGKEEVDKLILYLCDYVKLHFSQEEALQKEHNYPDYSDHKKEHERFMQDLNTLVQQLAVEGATLHLLLQTNQTTVNWLINHINITDRKLAEYLRSI